MATLNSLTTELSARLGDVTNDVWPAEELKGYLKTAIKTLYPIYFRHQVATTTADDGPVQTKPSGARNLHMIGLQRTGTTRVRPLRGWQEGDADAYVPKTGITGDTLVWAWTDGWDAPSTDDETLSIPTEAEDYVLTRAHILAIGRLLTDRNSMERYFSLNVREATNETDLLDQMDTLRAHLSDLAASRLPLPEKRQ